MAIFFTSDTHFNEQRAFDLSLRKMYFKDLQDYNQTVVDNWNKKVGKDDTIYHLGDFGDFSFLDKLNGKINLLYGNYERSLAPTYENKKNLNNVNDNYFQVEELNGEEILLVHEPENKFKYLREYNQEIFYLFGHIHEKQKVKRNGLNVGVDCHNFNVVDIETINFYKKAIQGFYDNNCFDSFGLDSFNKL